jgi:hypothetical protein
LQAQVHQAEYRVDEVKVKVDAFAPAQFEVEFFVHAAAAHKPGSARFNGTEHRYESFADAVALADVLNEHVLAHGARAQVDHRSARRLGHKRSRLTDAPGNAAEVLLEVLPQNPGAVQVDRQSVLKVERAQGALEPEAVPAADYARDKGRVLLHKCFHASAVVLTDVLYFHSSTTARPGRWRPPLLAAQPLWVLRGEKVFFKLPY